MDIDQQIRDLERKLYDMSVEVSKLTAAVAANTEATTAAVAVLKDPTGQEAVDAATTQVEANTAELVSATPQPAAPAAAEPTAPAAGTEPQTDQPAAGADQVV